MDKETKIAPKNQTTQGALRFAVRAANKIVEGTSLTAGGAHHNGMLTGRLDAALTLLDLAAQEYAGDLASPAYQNLDDRRTSLSIARQHVARRCRKQRAA